MKTDRYGKTIRYITGKQFAQLVNISEKTQPYLPFEEVAFVSLLKIALTFIYGSMNEELSLRTGLIRFNGKYYSRDFKINSRNLTGYQLSELFSSYHQPRMKEYMKHYQPIERDAFVMMFRACKRYIITGRTKESEDALIKRLREIKNILR